MDVWVVSEIDWGISIIIDVCDSKEKAEELQEFLTKRAKENDEDCIYSVYEQKVNSVYNKHFTKLHRALK